MNIYRDALVKILGGRCSTCKTKKNLTVHHVDGNRLNNQPGNLKVYCTNHHPMPRKSVRKSLKARKTYLKKLGKHFIQLKCHHCNQTWLYTGKSSWYATCPNCLLKVNIKNG